MGYSLPVIDEAGVASPFFGAHLPQEAVNDIKELLFNIAMYDNGISVMLQTKVLISW